MARPKYPSDHQDQFMVRMPPGMRQRLKEQAAAHNRSMNAEVISQLEYALQMSELNDRLEQAREENIPARQAYADSIAAAVNEERLARIESQLEKLIARLDK